MQAFRTWLIRALLVVVVVALIAGATFTAWGAWYALQAENTYHAENLVAELVCEHIELHKGAWPHSWSDLEALPARQWAMYDWPSESPEVQSRIAIDFAADPQKLAKQSPHEFVAIHFKGPAFGSQDERVAKPVLDELRKWVGDDSLWQDE